ncbi:hypothetical protein HDU92_002391 [Lobulomyces angularis]|nr:hypothetical protein HDU92_002391 [Lobulomyces angularis]
MNENEEIENLTKIENQILKLLDAQYKLSLTIHDFQSSAVLHERVNNLIIELRNLDNLKNLSNLKIPPQLIEYIHNNKNPDIYSKQLFQSLADKNQKTSGRINAIKNFELELLKQIKVNFPELNLEEQ